MQLASYLTGLELDFSIARFCFTLRLWLFEGFKRSVSLAALTLETPSIPWKREAGMRRNDLCLTCMKFCRLDKVPVSVTHSM